MVIVAPRVWTCIGRLSGKVEMINMVDYLALVASGTGV
jgi:hypothetical protein